MSTEMIAVRLTTEQKQRLDQLANQRNATVSDVIRGWIDETDTISSGITPAQAEGVCSFRAMKRTAERQSVRLSDFSTASEISPLLKEKLQEIADIREVSISELIQIGIEIVAYLHLNSWKILTFNKERTTRHLSESQQIVDLVNRHFSAPPVKWIRESYFK